MVRVIMAIEDHDLTVHRLVIEVKGPEEINIESCIEEIRAMAIKWAQTWLRHSGFEVAIKNKLGPL